MKKKTKKLTPSTPLNLKQAAADSYAEKNYKKALEYYKLLLKQQPSVEIQALISDCYIKRVQQLAQKNMYQEALVLWENHRAQCTDCTHLYSYLNLLLATGAENKAAAVFVENRHQLSEENRLILEEMFAALLVGKKDAAQLVKSFPEESPLLKDRACINQALTAYAEGDSKQAEILLGQIPFRSPYKHLRQVLKSCLLLPVDKTAALAVLDRIPQTSPFYQLGSRIKLSQAAPWELIKSLTEMSQSDYNLLSALKGWKPDQQKFLDKVRVLHNQFKPKVLLDLIIDHVSLIEKSDARRLCYSLLPLYMPSVKAFEKIFSALTVEEKMYLNVINSIYLQNQPPVNIWLKYEKTLTACKPQTKTIKLKRALILRQAVNFFQKKTGTLDRKSIAFLEKSLKLDPLDKSTYLQLIQYYQQEGRQDHCQQWIDKAGQTFSQDREIMLLAIEAATRNQPPEEIIRLAGKLLALDPLNKKAQQYRVEYQLQQAQAWYKTGDCQRAAAALAEIKAGVSAGFLRQKIDLNLALYEYSQGNYTASHQLITQYGDKDIGMRMQLAIQADLLCVPLAKLESKLKLTPLNKIQLQDANQLLTLIKVIEESSDNSAIHWQEIFKMIKKPLDGIVKRRLTEEELMTLCRCFTKIKQFKVVSLFIKSQGHIPYSPLLNYYWINAKIQGDPTRIKRFEYFELEKALEDAENKHDLQAAKLIYALLAEIDGDDDDDEDDEEFLEILEQVYRKMQPDKKKNRENSKPKQKELF